MAEVFTACWGLGLAVRSYPLLVQSKVMTNKSGNAKLFVFCNLSLNKETNFFLFGKTCQTHFDNILNVMQKRPNASHKLQFLYCYILIRLFDLDVWQSRSTCCLISYETSIKRSITLRKHKRIFCMAKIEWKNYTALT